MRSQGYLAAAVGVLLLLLWGAGLSDATWAEGKRLWVAQAVPITDEMPNIVEGPQNPRLTLDINDSIANLSALQVTVTAPQHRDLIIDTVTIGFGLPFGVATTTGDESFLDEMHVRLVIETVEVNGLQDNGEVTEGTRTITDLEDPTTVLFGLNPPLSLEAGTAVTFLAIVDINQPATQAAAAWLILPMIGVVSYISRSAFNRQRIGIMLLIVLSCGLMLAGCSSSNDDDELRFVVNLPSNGLTGQGQRLGPERAIAGTTIQLMR